MELDLASLDSVRRAAAQFLARGLPLHVLINNAGVYEVGPQRRVTRDGFELHFGTNHLGHFLLTHLLLERLIASGPARVVTLSSGLHVGGQGRGEPAHLDFDDLQFTRNFEGKEAYKRSKLANVLFAYELHRRTAALSPMLVVEPIAAHETGLKRLFTLHVLGRMPFARSLPHAGQNSVLAATHPAYAKDGGLYVEDHKPTASSPESYDAAVAARLWSESVRLCGVDVRLTSPARAEPRPVAQ